MKLKKLFAGILAVAMMATMAAPAFAATNGKTTSVNNNGGEFSITKTLTNASDTNVKDSTVLPEGAVASLTVVNNGQPVSYPTKVTPSDVAITQVSSANLNTATSKFTITMPNYTIPGVYTYYLTEADTGIAGIVPNTNDYRLTVYAVWDKAATDNTSAITLKVKMDEGILTLSNDTYTFEETDNTKIDTINNDYQAGTVTVTKKVDGTFARKDSEFDFNMTLTSDRKVKSTITYNTASGTASIAPADWAKTDSGWTVTKSFKLTADHTETFTNIPYGVNYTVSEMNGTTALNANDTVTIEGVEYTVNYDAKKTGEVGSVNEDNTVNYLINAEIKNVSGQTDVDTGVILDNAPYIALMMVVVAGAAVMIIKKRRHFED